MSPRVLRPCLIMFVALTAVPTTSADESAAATVVPLLTRELGGIAGKEALVVRVDYPPGGASRPHRHHAHVFVYVLAGAVTMQVDGQDPVTLHSGEMFYESPDDVHRQSANASATEPASLLVFFVKDQGRPASEPVSP